MANVNGMEELADELERIARIITDKGVTRNVLQAGAKPIVDRASNAMRHHRRTGRLDQGITAAFNETTERIEIGWDDKGFYGRFYESGYRPLAGSQKQREGKALHSWRKTAGRGVTVQRAHIRPAYAAEKDTVARRMIEAYQKEIGG